MAEVALKIQVNFLTGKRPVDPFKDPNLRPNATWQCLDGNCEMCLVLDGNAEPYRDMKGVKVIRGTEAIMAELRTFHKPRWKVYDQSLCARSIKQKNIDIADIDNKLAPNEEARILYERGALGIRETITEPMPPEMLRETTG